VCVLRGVPCMVESLMCDDDDRDDDRDDDGKRRGSRRRWETRNRYFDVAFGSALECAACLDICVCKKLITVDRQAEGKAALQQIVKRRAMAASVKQTRYGSSISHTQALCG